MFSVELLSIVESNERNKQQNKTIYYRIAVWCCSIIDERLFLYYFQAKFVSKVQFEMYYCCPMMDDRGVRDTSI